MILPPKLLIEIPVHRQGGGNKLFITQLLADNDERGGGEKESIWRGRSQKILDSIWSDDHLCGLIIDRCWSGLGVNLCSQILKGAQLQGKGGEGKANTSIRHGSLSITVKVKIHAFLGIANGNTTIVKHYARHGSRQFEAFPRFWCHDCSSWIKDHALFPSSNTRRELLENRSIS